MTFEEFVGERGPGLRAALVAAYGPEVGLDAASEALAYGWEDWSRLQAMDNPTGYLFRVGQSAARQLMRRLAALPSPPHDELPDFDPGLLPALAALSDGQRGNRRQRAGAESVVYRRGRRGGDRSASRRAGDGGRSRVLHRRHSGDSGLGAFLLPRGRHTESRFVGNARSPWRNGHVTGQLREAV